ncbi:MAG: type 4a pilus biogenesis protein PilO [Azoarcus sp.]|jgi:type IV pilus assembly protein PilO|nr:type 4a pilus biogenesis protein PilO [Azoarcus sp.]
MSGFDFQRLADDFSGLDTNDPGVWPLAPRLAVFITVFVAVVVAGWYFDWENQWADLAQKREEESRLRDSWLEKKKQAVNLEAYKQQLAEIDRQFGAMLRQLPGKAEMAILLADINQAGLGRGLSFDLFQPGNDDVKEFYAAVPVKIRVNGRYHDFGEFVADVAKMTRIVTINDIQIGDVAKTANTGNRAAGARAPAVSSGGLSMTAQAVTYRYLDAEEVASKRQAEVAGRRR